MPFRPLYLVTQFKNVTRPARGNEYTGYNHREDFWKVGLIHGFFPGVGINFFYESEPQAALFSLWEIVDQGAILDKAGITEGLVAQEIEQFKFPTWVYDVRVMAPAWRISFHWSEGQLDLWSLDEQDIDRFSGGSVYSILDLFGTLPTIPFDIEADLEAKAAQAKFADEEAARAKQDLADAQMAIEDEQAFEASDIFYQLAEAYEQGARQYLALEASATDPALAERYADLVQQYAQGAQAWDDLTAQQAARAHSDWANLVTQSAAALAHASALTANAEALAARGDADAKVVAKAKADAAAAAKAAADAKAKADAAAAKAKADAAAAAAQAARQAAYDTSWHPSNRPTSQSTDIWWSVSEGGATGYYDGVFFNSGTFFLFFDSAGHSNIAVNKAGSNRSVYTWFGTFVPSGKTILDPKTGRYYTPT